MIIQIPFLGIFANFLQAKAMALEVEMFCCLVIMKTYLLRQESRTYLYVSVRGLVNDF